MKTVEDILALAATAPIKAAEELEQLAQALTDMAAQIRTNVADSGVSLGGMSDRIQVRLVGPGGETKQYVDTGKGPLYEQVT